MAVDKKNIKIYFLARLLNILPFFYLKGILFAAYAISDFFTWTSRYVLSLPFKEGMLITLFI